MFWFDSKEEKIDTAFQRQSDTRNPVLRVGWRKGLAFLFY